MPVAFDGSNHTGPIGDLHDGRANFCTNGFIDSDFTWGAAEKTNSYLFNRYKIMVPKAGSQPVLLNLFKAFKKDTWIMTMLSIIFIFMVFKCMQRAQKNIGEHPSKYKFKDIFLNTYRSFLGDSIVARVPSATPVRCIFISWFIYSFLISNAFTCRLKSSLVQPGSLDDIDTLDALLKSNLKIMTFHEEIFFIKPNFGPQLWSKLNQNMINGSFFTFEKQFEENKTHAHMAHDYLIAYALSKTFDSSIGRPRYHVMAENLLTFSQVYFAELGSPFMQRFNELLGLFYQSGIISRWTMDSSFDNALANQFDVEKSEAERKEQDGSDFKIVISIDHLQTAFYLWAIGLTVSLIAFCAELVRLKCSRDENYRVSKVDVYGQKSSTFV